MNKRILGLSVAATAIVTTVFILYSFGASEPSSPGKVVPSNHRQPDNNAADAENAAATARTSMVATCSTAASTPPTRSPLRGATRASRGQRLRVRTRASAPDDSFPSSALALFGLGYPCDTEGEAVMQIDGD
eukprot:CAMPEP_0179857276 /NCGR_PEP_ID=MMETSP0982-20121206/11660_1 /TAXON_ID=483367 /ORGANISM="non described non described, Strain CCMP 2436" /LENGTH=131 /DNA_ID=CAMNT_0021743777 /DNA_START=203 /DNA_END=599 /DNA_ORIENTATION=+